jgi:hypothetical protein
MLKDYLQGSHLKIFDILVANQNGILEFIGVKKNVVDVIEREELALPNPEQR